MAEPAGAEVEELLASEVAGGGGPCARFETHGAVIFVGPFETLKIKRPVRYAYMDFSTLEQRRRACERELEVNRPHAPDIYLGLAAITREPDGSLALDGKGEAVEWAVRMRSFRQEDVLSNRIATGPFDRVLLDGLAGMVADYHVHAPVSSPGHDTAVQMARIIANLDDTFRAHPAAFDAARREEWRAAIEGRLAQAAPLLRARAEGGAVRRVHGDLHLGNIVLWQGRPVAFDAIEFDEQLATIDTLYDLAFLLMDLDRHGRRDHANAVLNRYLWRRQSAADLEGLAALPLFLSVRAGVRAMIGAQRADLEREPARSRDYGSAAGYLDLAASYLAPDRPVLVAIGGLSGTGKSTLARRLAPAVGAAPGALHLRSDLERKVMLGAGETERLGAEGYSGEVTARVYARLIDKARAALAAGHSVVIDAVHAREEERRQVAMLAAEAGVPLAGIWLEAPGDLLKGRVTARAGDASDATAEVVERQLAGQPTAVGWVRIDASGKPEDSLRKVTVQLECTKILKKSVEKS